MADIKKPGRRTEVTTRDIARASGVSTATVSYVLSGRPDARVSEETRKRVTAVAQQLGYRRNSLAAALRTGRMYTVGIVGPFTEDGRTTGSYNTYVKDLLLATSVAAARAGMNAVLFVERSITALPPEKLADRRVDGVILFGIYHAEAWMEALLATNIPYAEIGSSYGQYQVHGDNYGGARTAVEHLLSLGHRRIGHWYGAMSVPSAQKRREGFVDTMRAAGIPEQDAPLFNSADEFEALIRRPDRPTAFFLYNDELALQSLDLIHAAEMRVPEDVSLVGFDNSLVAGTMRPRLTSVQYPLDAMADAAIRLIKAQVDREEEPEIPAPIPTYLEMGKSTAPPSG